ncbi:MAG: hypothetical protein KDJ77_16580 [Rhodobiaceae bacterium]|nr:hypothetical protein [Rhodobiaceae bacterium]
MIGSGCRLATDTRPAGAGKTRLSGRVLVLAALAMFVAAPAAAQQDRIALEVPANVRTLLGSTALVGPDCTLKANTTRIIQRPKHGAVEIKVEPHTIGSEDKRLAQCAGMTIDGVSIYYQPDTGFTGEDGFALTLTEDGRNYPQKFVITVK